MKLFYDKLMKKVAQAYPLREESADAPVAFSGEFQTKMNQMIRQKQRAKQGLTLIRGGLAVAALAAVIPAGAWLWSLVSPEVQPPVWNPGTATTMEMPPTEAPTETPPATPEATLAPWLAWPEDAEQKKFTNDDETYYYKKYGGWGDAAEESNITLMRPGYLSLDVPLSRIEVIWRDGSVGAFAHYADDTEDYLYYAQQMTEESLDTESSHRSVAQIVTLGDIQGVLRLNFDSYYILRWKNGGILYELGGDASRYSREDLVAMALVMTEVVPGEAGEDEGTKPSLTRPENAMEGINPDTGEAYCYMDYANWGETGAVVPYDLARPTVLSGSEETREAMEYIRVMWYDAGRCEVYADYDMGADREGMAQTFRFWQVFDGGTAFTVLEDATAKIVTVGRHEAVSYVSDNGLCTVMWEADGILFALSSSTLGESKLCQIGESLTNWSAG